MAEVRKIEYETYVTWNLGVITKERHGEIVTMDFDDSSLQLEVSIDNLKDLRSAIDLFLKEIGE